MQKRLPYILTAIISLCLGGLAGWFINESSQDKIGELVFEYEENIEIGGYTLTKVVANGNKTVIIPTEYNGEDVVSIGGFSFSANEEVEEVLIPSSVAIIGCRAFDKCKNLREIVIPNSVKTIESAAFEECKNLTHVRIGKNVSEIDAFAFQGCISLTEISVHKDNEYYQSVDGNLYSSSFKSKIDILQQYAIGKTETSFSVPDGVSSIIYSAFSGSSLENILLPDSLRGAGFTDCKKLTNITIPDSVVAVSRFDGCSNLKSVTLPNTLDSLPTFRNCSSLESIIIPENVSVLSQTHFTGCTALTSITIPERIVKIGENAFSSCKNLTRIIFENTAYWTADCAGRDTVEFTKTELSNPETAAKYLTDTYRYYEWSQ